MKKVIALSLGVVGLLNSFQSCSMLLPTCKEVARVCSLTTPMPQLMNQQTLKCLFSNSLQSISGWRASGLPGKPMHILPSGHLITGNQGLAISPDISNSFLLAGTPVFVTSLATQATMFRRAYSEKSVSRQKVQLIKMPAEEETREKVSSIMMGPQFVEQTTLLKRLAGKSLKPLGVMVAVDLAFAEYQETCGNDKLYVAASMRKDDLIRELLKDGPEAVDYLKKDGLIED